MSTLPRRHWCRAISIGPIEILLLLVGAIVLALAIEGIVTAPSPEKVGYAALPKISFDRDAWVNYDRSNRLWTVRSQMIDDLLSRYQFMGMNRDAVVQLLGEPTKVDNDDFKAWDMLYRIGLDRADYSVDDEYLAFKFDKDGKVVAFRLVCT